MLDESYYLSLIKFQKKTFYFRMNFRLINKGLTLEAFQFLSVKKACFVRKIVK